MKKLMRALLTLIETLYTQEVESTTTKAERDAFVGGQIFF